MCMTQRVWKYTVSVQTLHTYILGRKEAFNVFTRSCNNEKMQG